MDTRLTLIKQWLGKQAELTLLDIQAASADASFRRYFRAQCRTSDGLVQSFIVMDAPPQQEGIGEFIGADLALLELGVHVPLIHASDKSLGFMLLEDLGDRTYLDHLDERADSLYADALSALVKIQNGTRSGHGFTPPQYSTAKLDQEMELFKDWFLAKHLGITLHTTQQQEWDKVKKQLIEHCVNQPQVWVHRDYHSRNLMITEQNSPGVIDFQDLVIGPVAYDLASIFKDCYIEWPRQRQLSWLKQYHQLANASYPFEQLIIWFDMCALQRHLKVLGIFCRLNYRDGKAQYLDDLPLVAKYVLEGLSLYPELAAFRDNFSQYIERAR